MSIDIVSVHTQTWPTEKPSQEADLVALEKKRLRAMELNQQQLELIQAAVDRAKQREMRYRVDMYEACRQM